MHSVKIYTIRFINLVQPKIEKNLSRTLFNLSASKPIEKLKGSHSNLLTDKENVFEVQHHIVKPSSMVNIRSLIFFSS